MRGWIVTCLLVFVATAFGQSKHPNPKPDSLEAQLYQAVQSGNEKEVSILLAKGAKVNTWNEGVPNPLFNLSGTRDQVEKVGKALIAAGADFRARTEEGQNLFTCWLIKGSDSNVSLDFFVTLGLDPNEPDGEGVLPLECAVLTRMTHIGPLVRAGANPRLKSKQGTTPLELFKKQFETNIAWRNELPLAENRAYACDEYLREMNGYLKLMDPRSPSLVNPGPRWSKDGMTLSSIGLSGLLVERWVRFSGGMGYLTLALKNEGIDQTVTFEDLTLQSMHSLTRLPSKMLIKKGETKKLTFEFRVPNQEDGEIEVIYSSTLYGDRTLNMFSDQARSIPSPMRAGSTPVGSDMDQIAIVITRPNVSIRIIEAKVDGKLISGIEGQEVIYSSRDIRQIIPGLLLPKSGKKCELTYEFRLARDENWHRTTVEL